MMHHALNMQTAVAAKKMRDIEVAMGRERLAQKWKKLFLWLPIILPILAVPGYFVSLDQYSTRLPNLPRDFDDMVQLQFSSLAVMLLLLLYFVWPLAKTRVYDNSKRFYAFIEFAIGLSIAQGIYWFCFGVLVTTNDTLFLDIGGYYFVFGPALALIATLVCGVSGLLYGWVSRAARIAALEPHQ